MNQGKLIREKCCICDQFFEYVYNNHARKKCDECKREHIKRYRNRSDIQKKRREYAKKYRNRPEIRERRLRYAKIYQKEGEYHKEYYSRPGIKEKKREYRREYNNNPKVKLRRKEYDQVYYSNPEAQEKRRVKQRRLYAIYKNNPRFQLNENVRSGIRQSLKRSKNNYHWEILVDYKLKELQAHLERQFQSGMTWKNYGKKWQIDHIIPISVFNFTKPEHIDFKKCWSLKNLKPLWAKENGSKSNKLDKFFQPSFLF